MDTFDKAMTTRRTVVKTGAKLAYAAPLVAATMKLSASGAAAASPPTGQQLTVLGTQTSADPTCIQIAGDVCWSATGTIRMCVGDSVRQDCVQVPSGANDVCNPGNTCCGGPYLCGELVALLDGVPAGSGASGCVSGSGNLCFYAHDSYYGDNDGQYTVTVS